MDEKPLQQDENTVLLELRPNRLRMSILLAIYLVGCFSAFFAVALFMERNPRNTFLISWSILNGFFLLILIPIIFFRMIRGDWSVRATPALFQLRIWNRKLDVPWREITSFEKKIDLVIVHLKNPQEVLGGTKPGCLTFGYAAYVRRNPVLLIRPSWRNMSSEETVQLLESYRREYSGAS
ncbi:MAG: hypothetical protein ACYS8W_15575 [Planctomycetota bacterium]|jgi:hypothetical protein